VISHLQLFHTLLKLIGMGNYSFQEHEKFFTDSAIMHEDVTSIRFRCGGQHSYYWGFYFDVNGKFIQHGLGEG